MVVPQKVVGGPRPPNRMVVGGPRPPDRMAFLVVLLSGTLSGAVGLRLGDPDRDPQHRRSGAPVRSEQESLARTLADSLSPARQEAGGDGDPTRLGMHQKKVHSRVGSPSGA